MILLETSAHTVASQEEIHPGEHRFISRNLRVVTYLRLGFGKSSCRYSDNNLCQVYGAEIRWIGSRPATSLTSTKIQNLSERLPVSFQNSQGVVPTKTDYTKATEKEVLTLSQSAAGLMPVPFLIRHWSCTENYSSMRGSSNYALWRLQDDGWNFFIRRHRMLNKRRKSCKPGSAISWSSSWTM